MGNVGRIRNPGYLDFFAAPPTGFYKSHKIVRAFSPVMLAAARHPSKLGALALHNISEPQHSVSLKMPQ
jgi:hypothetical protein